MILEANQVLIDARPVRLVFDQTFSKVVKDLTNQAETVNKAFRLRVADYRDVIEKLTNQKVEVRTIIKLFVNYSNAGAVRGCESKKKTTSRNILI